MCSCNPPATKSQEVNIVSRSARTKLTLILVITQKMKDCKWLSHENFQVFSG